MSSWFDFYANLALGLGTFFGTVALGLVIEARWIGQWSIRI